MEVRLDKRYPLGVDAARAWQVLRDVPTVAGCMPGASITEQVDATHYKGNVKVKVGPANAAFAGDIEVLALDDAARRLQLLGKGADRGGSSASMDLTATIEPGDTAEQSVLVGQAAVIVNGKFASFGGRLMGQVSDLLLAQFADNFRGVAAALPATASAGDVPADATAGLPAAAAPAEPTATAAIAATTAMVATTSTTSTTSTAAAGTPAPPTDTSSLPAPPASELNALSLAWGLIKNFFASLFGKRSA